MRGPTSTGLCSLCAVIGFAYLGRLARDCCMSGDVSRTTRLQGISEARDVLTTRGSFTRFVLRRSPSASAEWIPRLCWYLNIFGSK
ncbi:hypothetical protein EDC04DRAFT_2707131 [Pisolithus marmoratus]|nr:hypothetical protein EDC04DRAFT_2707131 [Pisolithus marmoratus]